MTPFISLYLSSGIEIMRDLRPMNRSVMRTYMPYCLHSVIGSHQYFIMLNRDYKPCGISNSVIEFAEYEVFKEMYVNKDIINPSAAEEIYGLGGKCYFFFSDSTNPFNYRKGKGMEANELFKRYKLILEDTFKLRPLEMGKE